MTERFDLCVIGAGSGGLSIAAAASQMGASVAIVEANRMGGDCLNFGCIPSKSLLAAAGRAAVWRDSGEFGIAPQEPNIDFAGVMAHVASVIRGIAPTDSIERFQSLGCTVIRAGGRFVNPTRLEAGDRKIEAKRFVIASGSRPKIPPIPGLDKVAYLTNETVFSQRRKPDHLIVIGGGAIGCELALAHRRLGIKVTMIEVGAILPKEDPELVAVVRSKLNSEGIVIVEGSAPEEIVPSEGGVHVLLQGGRTLQGDNLLVATGRAPNTETLNLSAADVSLSNGAIEVDHRLRTTNRKIFAIGDCIGGALFTHAANYHAGIVIQNALLRIPARLSKNTLPRVTFIDPELAHVGLTASEATKAGHQIEVLKWSFEENDRARTERHTEGMIKVIIASGRVLGASIVGAHAGELITPWTLAVNGKVTLKDLATTVIPYPTLSEVTKRVAGSRYSKALFSRGTRTLVRLLAKLP